MQTKSEAVLYQVNSQVRHEYLGLFGRLTADQVIKDIETKSNETDLLLSEIGYRTSGLDMEMYVGLTKYAIEGDCSYFLSPEGTSSSLYDQWGCVVGLLESFEAFEEFNTSPGISVPTVMMLNMLRPRVTIDISRLDSSESDSLSLIELALLAGMKEGSVRNSAVPGKANCIETHKSSDGNTYVTANDAHAWLLERRRYQATNLPESASERKKLLQHFKTIDL